MQIHWFSIFCFHKLTLLSPPETARMSPVMDQLTFQTTSVKVFRIVGDHVTRSSLFHMITRRSWEQLAICDRGSPILGAQATSRTQSECTSKRFSSTQRSPSSFHILIVLSHPPVANRLIANPRSLFALPVSKVGSNTVDGHQETALHPIIWAFGIFLESHVPFSKLHVRIDTEPSEDPQASTRPYSAGAHATELTEESWLLYSCHFCHSPISFQTITFRS